MFYGQQTQQDSIQLYFNQIEELIDNKDLYKDDFVTIDFLLDKKGKAEGIEKVDILHQLFILNAVYNSIDVTKKYNDEAMQLARTLNYKEGEMEAKLRDAYLHFIGGDFNTSMRLYYEVDGKISYEKNPMLYARLKNLKSDIHTEKGEYDMALETGLNLLDIGEKTKNDFIIMKGHAALSHYYLRIENYSKALSHCLTELHYIIEQRIVPLFFPKVNEIGRMSTKLNNLEGAVAAYSFFIKLEKEISLPGSYVQSIVYMNMADLYMARREFKKSQNYLSRAIILNYENDYRFRIPRALILQAELSLHTKDTTAAILNYEKSITAAENINAFDVIKSNSHILVGLYKKTQQPAKVYEYKTLYDAIKDSLFSNEKEQRIIILEARRKIKEVTQKQKILELENLAQKANFNTIKIILLFSLMISGFIVFSYIKVKKKNKLLYQRTIELAEIHLKIEDNLSKNYIRTETEEGKEYHKTHTAIDSNIKNIILCRLEKLEKENFFIDSNCNLHQLSEKLKTNSKYLSQVINQEKGSNFNNYINELRINYLLAKLLKDVEYRNSKLSYIAVSVGYNNLNTFNAAFKKRQGILPSYFISELNNESEMRKSYS
ncbi:MAG: hypothetical protein COA50_03455 [Flavobacteriaceae bacterium]|nr:MAG: hypothetical protein COA50_03455 [Flavobacteriaceae bacterium]